MSSPTSTAAEMLPLDELAELTSRLRDADMDTMSVTEVKDLFTRLTTGHKFMGASSSTSTTWLRGRICDDPNGFSSLRQVIYPPVTNDFGRAHIPGRRVFYSSFGWSAVLSEICAQPGQMVQIIGARTIPGREIRCLLLGELAQLAECGTSRTNIAALPNSFHAFVSSSDNERTSKTLLIDVFLAQEFRTLRPRCVDYKLTAAIAEWCYESSTAVTYPSVQRYVGENLAIPAELFNPHFEILWTWLLRVDAFYGYGAYSVIPLKFCSEFDADGRINWGSPNRLNASVAPPMAAMAYVPRVDPKHVGWRVT